eukprot:gnl/TRDRNA2_/TRDRNA2_126398_c0_seq2.p1 gnl/TRDRNA2_/TRDRNA2_126398_c0~~gnl/TRDRNA2_/TRDRNA2_126398_c0_seq2.p1  ORF type:complete len:320 (+),score=47.11 gnl/TRDRNA2_/TRDRNA2_126398_c0_seq2:66-962(+)
MLSDLDQLWAAVLCLLLPDLSPLAHLGGTCRDIAASADAAGAVLLRTWLRAPGLLGSPNQIRACATALAVLRCNFMTKDSPIGDLSAVSVWDGPASSIAEGGNDWHQLRKLRQRFPEAVLRLWQTSFPEGAAALLNKPLASAETVPAAEIRVGTAVIKLSLVLKCVAEAYFNPAAPLRSLLAQLSLTIAHDDGLVWPGGVPGPEGNTFCGVGHRWCCVCLAVEEDGPLPGLFCSLRESYLRPCWRDPRVMSACERSLLHWSFNVNGEHLDGRFAEMPLRLALALYRTDDDEGPDEPED